MSIELIRALADWRAEPFTSLFQFFTFLGEVEGYVLLVTLIYFTFDKALAYRLSVLTLVTMSINHLLKTLIMNPRPFISEGTWAEQWAVAPDKAAELATEFSTPSGHAMAAAAFYAYLFASVENTRVRVASVVLVLLIGLSRPFLGVHYLEDVLLGWLLGLSIALLALRHASKIRHLWSRLSRTWQLAIVVAGSLVLWAATRALTDPAGVHPLPYIGYTGFLLGVVVAFPLELELADLDPRSSPAGKKVLRILVGVALIMGTLWALDHPFQLLAGDHTVVGHVLRYLRYALAGIAGILVAPILVLKSGLAEPASR